MLHHFFEVFEEDKINKNVLAYFSYVYFLKFIFIVSSV